MGFFFGEKANATGLTSFQSQTKLQRSRKNSVFGEVFKPPKCRPTSIFTPTASGVSSRRRRLVLSGCSSKFLS
ncbi:hypothetical protein PanWU01x14_253350, partial [Parasponia andersonii]